MATVPVGNKALLASSDVGIDGKPGIACHCNDLLDIMLDGVTDTVKSRAGILAFVVLSGSYATKSVAKSMHKNGDMTCYTYRKIKEMTSAQPWFTLPLIISPLFHYNGVVSIRPPFLAYALMVGGWVLNNTGYVLQIAHKDDKYKQQYLPPSYLCWILAMFTATSGLFFNALRGKRA